MKNHFSGSTRGTKREGERVSNLSEVGEQACGRGCKENKARTHRLVSEVSLPMDEGKVPLMLPVGSELIK